MAIEQIPSIILPIIHPLGTEVEAVADALEHTSLEPARDTGESIVNHLQEKTLYIFTQEIVAAGVPGPLWIWIEESPYPTSVSGAFWSAIGGGGGPVAPANPLILAGTGVNGALQNASIKWTSHSPFVRVVVQTPVAVATAVWAVQLLLAGKGK